TLERRRRANGANARIHVGAPPAVARSPPTADVVVLDHHVRRVRGDPDRVLLRATKREVAHDHVRGVDGDVVGRGVLRVERGATTVVHHVAAGTATLRDVVRRTAAGNRD